MNFQIYPLTVRINGQNNGIRCGVNIFKTYGCVAKNVETFGGSTKLTLLFLYFMLIVQKRTTKPKTVPNTP